jgi:hypothetical protein
MRFDMSEDSNKRVYEAAVNAAVLSGEFVCWACHHTGPHRAVGGEVIRFECAQCGTVLDEHDVREATAQGFTEHAAETIPELPVSDTIPPAMPLPVIPRGHAVATWHAALADLHHALENLAATGDALARALDA